MCVLGTDRRWELKRKEEEEERREAARGDGEGRQRETLCCSLSPSAPSSSSSSLHSDSTPPRFPPLFFVCPLLHSTLHKVWRREGGRERRNSHRGSWHLLGRERMVTNKEEDLDVPTITSNDFT